MPARETQTGEISFRPGLWVGPREDGGGGLLYLRSVTAGPGVAALVAAGLSLGSWRVLGAAPSCGRALLFGEPHVRMGAL